MSTMSGACVCRARFAAADGRPIPTKQTQPFHSSRDAATVIISSAVNAFGSAILRLRHPDRAQVRRVVRRPADVAIDPLPESRAIAGNLVPREIEGVVPRVVALRVRWIGAARHAG